MMKLVKTTVFLASLGVVSTQEAGEQAGCALDGASAVSDISDAAVYLWAATERCTTGSTSGGNPLAPRCEMDIAAAMEAVNNMILVIVKAAKDCGSFKSESYECGTAVGQLTGASAGLGAGLGMLAHECAKELPSSGNPGLGVADTTASMIGQCITDAKNSISNLFKASNTIANIKPGCEPGSEQCARNALSVVSFFSAMGSAMAGAAQHCGKYEHVSFKGAGCAKAVLKSVSTLSAVSNAAVNVAGKCAVSEERLYSLEKVNQPGTPMSTIAMAAFIPLGVALGFVGGTRLSKARNTNAVRTVEPDQEALTLCTDDETAL